MLSVHRTWKNVSITLWVNGTDQTKKITFSKSDTKKSSVQKMSWNGKRIQKKRGTVSMNRFFYNQKGS